MKMSSRVCAGLAVLTVSAIALGTAGCDPVEANAIGASELAVVETEADKPANPDDPYGSCLPDGEEPFSIDDMFPFRCSQAGAACTGWGGGGSCDTDSCNIAPFHAVCDHICDTDADCPIPGTGDAVPTCITRVHACELPCDEETQCPDGYTCQSTEGWGLSDSEGPIPLPFICMQTLTVTFVPSEE